MPQLGSSSSFYSFLLSFSLSSPLNFFLSFFLSFLTIASYFFPSSISSHLFYCLLSPFLFLLHFSSLLSVSSLPLFFSSVIHLVFSFLPILHYSVSSFSPSSFLYLTPNPLNPITVLLVFLTKPSLWKLTGKKYSQKEGKVKKVRGFNGIRNSMENMWKQ